MVSVSVVYDVVVVFMVHASLLHAEPRRKREARAHSEYDGDRLLCVGISGAELSTFDLGRRH